MDKFEILFGIKKSCIKENCVLMPFVAKYILKNLNITDFKKGKIYSSADAPGFTIIQTGIGPGFTGDAVLFLKDTACKNIILFGSCGLLEEKDRLSVGSLVSPSKCYSHESFSSMLLNPCAEDKIFYPDKTLFEKIIKQNIEIKNVACATVSSLKLEEENINLFRNKNIDVFDMECSALFSAGNHAGIKTAALFYISDIINDKPFYMNMDNDLKLKISGSINKAIAILTEIL
ncbi:MAG: hypothetical protein AB1498_06455 [bacterium]